MYYAAVHLLIIPTAWFFRVHESTHITALLIALLLEGFRLAQMRGHRATKLAIRSTLLGIKDSYRFFLSLWTIFYFPLSLNRLLSQKCISINEREGSLAEHTQRFTMWMEQVVILVSFFVRCKVEKTPFQI